MRSRHSQIHGLALLCIASIWSAVPTIPQEKQEKKSNIDMVADAKARLGKARSLVIDYASALKKEYKEGTPEYLEGGRQFREVKASWIGWAEAVSAAVQDAKIKNLDHATYRERVEDAEAKSQAFVQYVTEKTGSSKGLVNFADKLANIALDFYYAARKHRREEWESLASLFREEAKNWPTWEEIGREKKQEQGLGVKELPAPEDRWALVVGIGQYDNPMIPNEDIFGDVDAKAFADALEAHAEFDHHHVIRLYSGPRITRPPENERLLYATPTRNNLLKTLWQMTYNVPPNGLLLIFFSGHGGATTNTDVLFTEDAPLLSDDEGLIASTAITADNIKWAVEKLRKKGLRQLIVILDACRDSQGVGEFSEVLTPRFIQRFTSLGEGMDAFAAFFSTQANERAYPDPRRGMGFFAEALVEGLEGKGADDQGRITLRSLAKYVRQAVQERVKAASKNLKNQDPYLHVEGYRDEEVLLSTGVPHMLAASPAGVVRLDFDSVETSSFPGYTLASSYLAKFGISLEDVTPGTEVQIKRNNAEYWGVALLPPSLPNFLKQTGSGPVSFTLKFKTPLRSVTFTRPELLSMESGITHPEWSAHAFNRNGQEVSRCGEAMIRSFGSVAAKTFTLGGGGIIRVRFDSDNHRFAAFGSVLIDDLVLDPETN